MTEKNAGLQRRPAFFCPGRIEKAGRPSGDVLYWVREIRVFARHFQKAESGGAPPGAEQASRFRGSGANRIAATAVPLAGSDNAQPCVIYTIIK